MPPSPSFPSSPHLSPSLISQQTIQTLLSLYARVLSRFYGSKVKDSRKREEALETDRWRYGGLVGVLEGEKGVGGLKTEEVERLVGWKITHNTNRPFLLPMIRKNAPSLIESSTSQARRLLLSSASPPSVETITQALTITSTPKGIGPATASLLLSIFDPQKIPFFEDELYFWLCSSDGDGGKETKLKYSVKEYVEMVRRTWSVMERLNRGRDGRVEAWMLEKVAFVLGHWDLVEMGEREGLEGGNGGKRKVESLGDGGEEDEEEEEEEGGKSEVKRVKTVDSGELGREDLKMASEKEVKGKKTRQQDKKQELKKSTKSQDQQTAPRRSGRKR